MALNFPGAGAAFSTWAENDAMANYRELQFGPFQFPLSCQEKARDSTLKLIKKKIPFTPGDFNPSNSSMSGRTTEFYGTVGSGMIGSQYLGLVTGGSITPHAVGGTFIVSVSGSPNLPVTPGITVVIYDNSTQASAAFLVTSSSPTTMHITVTEIINAGTLNSGASVANMILTQDDLEAERSFLAGMQALGTQQLWVRPDRYLNAFLEDFSFDFVDGGSFRYADWSCKFYTSDPRYFGDPHGHDSTNGPYSADTSTHTIAVEHAGNTKAFPIITFSVPSSPGTGTCLSPRFWIQQGGGGPLIGIGFTGLLMKAGDTLSIACDPRPDTTQMAIIYTGYLSDGVPTNGFVYVTPPDFRNTLDFQYFLPYIETSLEYGVGTTNQTLSWDQFDATNGHYEVTVSYADTWI